MNAHEIHIISATIEVYAAASAWSLQHGIILYRGRYYIPATSPLLQELLEPLGTQVLAVSLHTATSTPATQAIPSSVLLIEDWPQHILSSATIIFNSNADYDTGNLNFSTWEHLTTSPLRMKTVENGRKRTYDIEKRKRSVQDISTFSN
jgi:hypothetical protein